MYVISFPLLAQIQLDNFFSAGNYLAKDAKHCLSGGMLRFRDNNRGLILGDRISFKSVNGKVRSEKLEIFKQDCELQVSSNFSEDENKLSQITKQICKAPTKTVVKIFVISLEKQNNNLLYTVSQVVDGKQVGKRSCLYIKSK